MKNLVKYLCILFIFFIAFACRKMDSTYYDYIKYGEILYASKADSVKVYSGKERIKLTIYPGVDPKIVRYEISYNNKTQKLQVPVTSTTLRDSIDVIIDSLIEGSYTFNVVAFDSNGISSVEETVSGTVYGEDFQSMVQNRRVRMSEIEGDILKLSWYNAMEGAIYSQIVYTNTDSKEVKINLSVKEEQNTLQLLDLNSSITYRTLFLPDTTAIDTFYTDFEVMSPLFKLDKHKFQRWNPIDIPYSEFMQGNGFNIEKLWDEVYSGHGYVSNACCFPSSFTFDLGEVVNIKKVLLNPAYTADLYSWGSVRKLKLYASDSPDVTADLSTWQYIGDYNSVKPSGLPIGNNTGEDAEYAMKGEYFTLHGNISPARYIRMVVEQTWGGVPTMHITELTFWGEK